MNNNQIDTCQLCGHSKPLNEPCPNETNHQAIRSHLDELWKKDGYSDSIWGKKHYTGGIVFRSPYHEEAYEEYMNKEWDPGTPC